MTNKIVAVFFSGILFCGWGKATEPRLCTSSTHPMCYYVVEPTQKPTGRIPVLVCVAGADADFAATARRFAESRGDTPILLIVPCTFSNSNVLHGPNLQRYLDLYGEATVDAIGGSGLIPDVRRRLAWDENGLCAIVADLQRADSITEQVFLTGFSGGGNLAWWMSLRQPELLAGVVPVCSNFAFWSMSHRDASPGERATPILALSGERDTLRHSRVSLPMPPVGVTLSIGLALGVGIGRYTWRTWQRIPRVLLAELIVVALIAALVAGKMSGNDFQTEVAVNRLRRLGHPVAWKHQPGLWHDPAPSHVLQTIAQWNKQRGDPHFAEQSR